MRVGLIGMTLGAGAALGAEAQAQTPKQAQAREMEILRKTLAEQQSNPGQIIRTPQTLAFSTNAAVSASRADLERQYLDGKLTAKQFQKSLEQLQEQERRQAVLAARTAKAEANVPKSSPAASAPAANSTAAKPSTPPPPPGLAVPAKERPTGAAGTATATSLATNVPNATSVLSPGEVTPEQKTLSEVETRIEEMLRLKAERDKAATNATGNASTKVPAGPLTRRQRLDGLLKQYVDGKLTESEYNAQRSKIIAEPD